MSRKKPPPKVCVVFKVSPQQRRAIRASAREAGVTVSEWIRWCIMKGPMVVNLGTTMRTRGGNVEVEK